MTGDLRFRPVLASDGDFLLRVFASTRAAELSLMGWDAAQREAFVQQQCKAQALHYATHWPDAQHEVIQWQGGDGQYHDVGRQWLHRRPDALHLLDIALLDAWRGQGIGGECLRRLQDEAASAGLALTIYVEQDNPARRLYDRMGFLPVGPLHGIHQLMRWQAQPGALAPLPEEALSEQA